MTEQLQIAFNSGLEALDGSARRVWMVLRDCRGRKQALTAEALARATGLTPKEVQALVSDLVTQYDKLIGSACHPPRGFYVITDSEELERACRQLRSRGLKCLLRVARLKHQALEEVFGQARLEL